MDSRERTFMALGFEEPDRVPIDLWLSKGFEVKLQAQWGLTKDAVLDRHDVDLRYIEGPRYIGPPFRSLPQAYDEDIWGVVRRAVEVDLGDGKETYREVHESPLAAALSIEEIDDYDRWPSPDWFDYSDVEAQCEAIRSAGRVVVFMGDRLNRLAQLKPAMYLRGVERILVDMADCPHLVHALFGHIRRFCRGYAERIFDAACGKIDIVLTGDDFGSQNGPLVSPAMWLEFLGDGFAEYVGLARSQGIRVMHHTCGSVRPLIPLMQERGLDVLQSLQPEAEGMDAGQLKQEFGDRLAFHGGISIQQTMPFGLPQDVRDEVKSRIEALAPGGGYIISTAHNIQADVPMANFDALLEAYRAYGVYRR